MTTTVLTLLGVGYLGATAVPVDERMTTNQITAVIEDCSPALLVTASAIDEQRACPSQRLDEVAAAIAVPTAPRRVQRRDSAVPLLLYTSGSSGVRKAVVCDAPAMGFVLDAVQQRLGYVDADVILSALPLSFDYGLYQLYLALRSGAALHLRGTMSLARFFKDADQVAATVLPVLPGMAEVLIAASRRTEKRPPVRLITNTGERLTRETQAALFEVFPEATIAVMYGLTECKRVSIGLVVRATGPTDSVGVPLDGTFVTIEGPDHERLPDGRVGRIVVHGPHVMQGYRSDDVASSEQFTSEPDGTRALRTGDLGMLSEGSLYVLGRMDGQFKVRGVRTSAAEIEDLALGVAVVRAAVVEHDAERVTLWVESDGDPLTVERGVRRQVGDLLCPEEVRVVSAIPLAPTGKRSRHPSRP